MRPSGAPPPREAEDCCSANRRSGEPAGHGYSALVRIRHFEQLRPLCPVCRGADGAGFPLKLAHVERETPGDVLEGALHCTNPDCLREYPVLDGIPVLVRNIRQYVADNLLAIYGRGDLSAFAESMLGDCSGPGSAFDSARQHLSSYAWDHYGDLAPANIQADSPPGSMLRTLRAGLDLAGLDKGTLEGPILEAGCSVGRGTFALAERAGGIVLGVDLHFPMLRVASEVLRRGVARFPFRRVGLVYDRLELPARFPQAENVDFWACDASALPFAKGTFAATAAMNVLDCVHSPRDLLVSLAGVLRPGGRAILSCPYDWSPSATPVEAWLGGHSQRAPTGGSSEAVLRTLLTPGAHPGSIKNLKLAAERAEMPWHVRLHDRSTMTYKAHLVVAEKD